MLSGFTDRGQELGVVNATVKGKSLSAKPGIIPGTAPYVQENLPIPFAGRGALPTQADGHSALYSSLSFSSGQTNDFGADHYWSLHTSVYAAHQFGFLQFHYGANVSLGSYTMGKWAVDTTPRAYYSSVSRQMPDSIATLIDRDPLFATLGLNTELVIYDWEACSGLTTGYGQAPNQRVRKRRNIWAAPYDDQTFASASRGYISSRSCRTRVSSRNSSKDINRSMMPEGVSSITRLATV
jgi:hypothetical protein